MHAFKPEQRTESAGLFLTFNIVEGKKVIVKGIDDGELLERMVCSNRKLVILMRFSKATEHKFDNSTSERLLRP